MASGLEEVERLDRHREMLWQAIEKLNELLAELPSDESTSRSRISEAKSTLLFEASLRTARIDQATGMPHWDQPEFVG